MEFLFPLRIKRWLSGGSIVLLLWSLGWSVSAEAFSDWFWIETAPASQGYQLSSSPTKPGMKDTCNAGCLALTHLLGLGSGDFAMPLTRAACIGFSEEPQTLHSIFSDRLYHPPRHISFTLES